MFTPVPIRQPSKEWARLLRQTPLSLELQVWLQHLEAIQTIDAVELIAWLTQTIPLENEALFLLESLRTALLNDLYDSILDPQDREDDIKDSPHEAFFEFLVVAGTIVAICEGFDGIASILGIFPTVPALFIFLAGVIFAALSVIVFRGFDMVTIAQNLGVNIETNHHLVSVFLAQVEQIDKLREAAGFLSFKTECSQDRKILRDLVAMLIIRYNALDAFREAYAAALHAPYLTTTKLLTSIISGVVFFGSGFFSGQSVALTGIYLFTSGVSALFWPIFAISSIVGIAAFSIYWFVERPGLESLVSRWLGLDEDKINVFIEERAVNRHKRGLSRLETQLNQIEGLKQNARGRLVEAPTFFRRSRSMNDIDRLESVALAI